MLLRGDFKSSKSALTWKDVIIQDRKYSTSYFVRVYLNSERKGILGFKFGKIVSAVHDKVSLSQDFATCITSIIMDMDNVKVMFSVTKDCD